MKTMKEIRDDLATIFPDVDPSEEEFHLWLGAVTSHLADMSADPAAFRVKTAELCSLLNNIYDADGDSYAKATLTDEVMEFYASDDDRLALAKGLLKGPAATELDMAKGNVDFWRGKTTA